MTEKEIKAAIERHIDGRYSAWTIGVTDDLDRRKGEHKDGGKDVSCWHHWDASTEKIARDIEDYFHNKGCKGGGGGKGNANYVYIF